MNVLLDMNVVLDVILSRDPCVAEASQVWDSHEDDRPKAWIAAFSIPTIFYVVRRQVDLTAAHEAVRICLETFEIARWAARLWNWLGNKMSPTTKMLCRSLQRLKRVTKSEDGTES